MAFVAIEAAVASYCIYLFPKAGLIFYGILLWLFLSFSSSNNRINEKTNENESLLFSFVYFALYALSVVRGWMPDNIQWLFLFFGFSFLWSGDIFQSRITKLFIKLVAILFLLSIVEFVFYSFFHLTITDKIVNRGNYRQYHNLLFNVVEDLPYFVIFPRFQSLLDEPGLVGTLSAFMLCCIWKLKKWNFEKVIFIVSGLFSFSLAFYLMLAIIIFMNVRINYKYFFATGLLLFGAYYLLHDYINALVISRFSEDDVLSRTAMTFDIAYQRAWNNGQLWFGLGATSQKLVTEAGDGNAGIKVWIYQYGIIGLFFLAFVYFKVLISKMKRSARFNKAFFTLLILLVVSFIQRSDIEAPYYVVVLMGFPAFYKSEYLKEQVSEHSEHMTYGK